MKAKRTGCLPKGNQSSKKTKQAGPKAVMANNPMPKQKAQPQVCTSGVCSITWKPAVAR